MDEITTKNSLSNDVHKKYAHTKEINGEYPLDAGVIAQSQRNELAMCTSESKHKIRDNKNYLRTMYDTSEIILCKNECMYHIPYANG